MNNSQRYIKLSDLHSVESITTTDGNIHRITKDCTLYSTWNLFLIPCIAIVCGTEVNFILCQHIVSVKGQLNVDTEISGV